jgi:uncharacterized membrane protein SpoIIM required for sporulation
MIDNKDDKPRASPAMRLGALNEKIEKVGLNKLSTDELIDFGRNYRRVTSLLSRIKSIGLTGADAEHLNKTAATSYAIIYSNIPAPKFSPLRFITEDFPAAMRQNVHFVLFSAAAFLLPAIFCFFFTLFSPELPDVILGTGWTDEIVRLASRHEGTKNWLPEAERPIASSMIMTNNIKVSFLAFATGISYGVLTLWIIIHNGMLLGTVAAVVHLYGVSLNFWGFVLPHGVIELTAIVISGGAGFKIGYSLINPGRYTKKDALKLAARESLPLIGGVVCMLAVAGIIEAFVSPMVEIPSEMKIAFSFLEGLALFLYLGFSGKKSVS